MRPLTTDCHGHSSATRRQRLYAAILTGRIMNLARSSVRSLIAPVRGFLLEDEKTFCDVA